MPSPTIPRPPHPALSLAGMCLLLLGACGEEPPDRGLESLSGWRRLPELGAGRYRQHSSHQRDDQLSFAAVDPRNKDFNSFLARCGGRPETQFQESDDQAALCAPGMEGYLIAADDDGPGFVSRLWITTSSFLHGLSTVYEREVLRVYVDDLERPAYEARLADLEAGTAAPPLVPPFTVAPSGAILSYLPLSYRRSLRVLLDGLMPFKIYYYQVDRQSTDATAAFAPDALDERRLVALARHLTGEERLAGELAPLADGLVRLPAGAETVILDHRGAGTIRHLRLAFGGVTAEDLRQLELELRWEEEERAAARLPLAAFFGCQQQLAPFDTLPLQVVKKNGGVRLSAYFPMPFAGRARVRLINRGARDLVTAAQIAYLPGPPAGDWGHFRAAYHEEQAPLPAGARYPVVDLQGRGKYVGTMMYLRGGPNESTISPSVLNFLEGDELGLIDGEAAIPGTGTEDYLNGGFYFKQGPFSHPFSALIHKVEDEASRTGEITAVRWHVLGDAIDFQRSFALSFEYGADEPRTALHYATVAYYYLRE